VGGEGDGMSLTVRVSHRLDQVPLGGQVLSEKDAREVLWVRVGPIDGLRQKPAFPLLLVDVPAEVIHKNQER